MSVVVDRRHAATPQKLADWAIKRYGLELDVCASPWNHKLPRYYSLEREENGLMLPWDAASWCNPPWSEIEKWLQKSHEEMVDMKRCPLVVFCLPERRSVKWWKRWVERAHWELSVVIHDFEGRIVYDAQPGSIRGQGGFEPSVLVVFERRLRARDFCRRQPDGQ